jgi:hypothetical protein
MGLTLIIGHACYGGVATEFRAATDSSKEVKARIKAAFLLRVTIMLKDTKNEAYSEIKSEKTGYQSAN